MKITLDTEDVKAAIKAYIADMGLLPVNAEPDMKIIKLRAADELSVEITFPPVQELKIPEGPIIRSAMTESDIVATPNAALEDEPVEPATEPAEFPPADDEGSGSTEAGVATNPFGD